MTSTSEARIVALPGASVQDTGGREALDALEAMLGSALAGAGSVALILLNVPQHRDFSIALGHRGVAVLMNALHARLATCLRPADVVIPLASGDIAVVLPGLRNGAQPLMAVNRLRRALENPLQVGDLAFNVRLVAGLAVGPRDARAPARLLTFAESALRHALEHHLPVCQYSEIAQTSELPLIGLEQGLRSALEQNEVTSAYRPIIDIDSGDLVAVEFEPRWHCAPYGAMDPALFLRVAAQAELLAPATMWEFNTGLRECVDWQRALPGLAVALNLSPAALCEPYISEQLLASLRVWSMDPTQLTVELSEQSLVIDPGAAARTLQALFDAGVRIAIDDFGAGYSSLGYLKTLPIHAIKIARGFIGGMKDNSADRRIVKSVIDLAHNFEMTVVATGVEDEETLDALTLMGCQRAQGRVVADAMPAAALGDWLAESPWTLRAVRRGTTLA